MKRANENGGINANYQLLSRHVSATHQTDPAPEPLQEALGPADSELKSSPIDHGRIRAKPTGFFEDQNAPETPAKGGLQIQTIPVRKQDILTLSIP